MEAHNAGVHRVRVVVHDACGVEPREERMAGKVGETIERCAMILMLLVFSALGVRVFFVTMPKLDGEVDEARNLSLIAIQNGNNLKTITEREKTDIPATQGKLNKVLDDTHTLLQTTNKKIAELDTKGISGETVNALKALSDGLTTTASSVKQIGEQTIKSEQAIAQTADSATKTAQATTETAQASTTLVKGITQPVIKATQNVQAATGDVKDAAAEAKQWLHSALHPKWPKVVWGEVKDFAAKTLGAWL